MQNQKEQKGTIYGKQKMSVYFQYMPEYLKFQFVSGIIIAVVLFIASNITQILIGSLNRAAFVSGDVKLLFLSAQGWVIIFTYIIVAFIFVGLELNGAIILSDKLFKGEETRTFAIIKDAFKSLPLFLNGSGFLLFLYIVIGVPLAGLGFGVSLTNKLYLPNFITSVILSTPKFAIPYYIAVLLIILFGIRNAFILPAVVLENEKASKVVEPAHKLIKDNWRNLLKVAIIDTVKLVVILLVITVVLPAILEYLFLSEKTPLSTVTFVTINFTIFFMLIALIVILMAGCIAVGELTRMYLTYRDGEPVALKERREHVLTVKYVPVIIGFMIISIGLTVTIDTQFDELLPQKIEADVVVHRLGGNYAGENTLEGELKSIASGAAGLETDVQRSADGVYVINHDSTFERLCGVDKAASEMTAAEIKQLNIIGPDGTVSHPATLVEVLDTAKGKTHLFIEFKYGDEKMVDDVISMIKERGMENECTVIGTDYELISYSKAKYPEVETGLLYFFAFGSKSALNGDVMIIEEEAAKLDVILGFKFVGKRVLVWTVNTEASANRELIKPIDGVISDEPNMCNEVKEKLENRSEIQRFLDALEIVF